MKTKIIPTILIIFIFIIAISQVTAIENDVGNYEELQNRIDNATVGEVISLDKNYMSNSGEKLINISKDITIDGTNLYGENFFIDGNGNGMFYLNEPITLTLINVTLKNTNAVDGGAIYSNYDLNLICKGTVIFDNNTAQNMGGAIFAKSSIIDIKGNGNLLFLNNHAIKSEGGAIITFNGEININYIGNLLFENNTSGSAGGAMYTFNCIYMNVSNAIFKNNYAKINGGAISTGQEILIIDCSKSLYFINNSAESGGALWVTFLEINNKGDTYFINNSAIENGGAIFSNDITFNTKKSLIFNNNIVSNGFGGAIVAFRNLNISNAYFTNNIAIGDEYNFTKENYNGCGGAIIVQQNGTINNCIFDNNYASNFGDAIGQCDLIRDKAPSFLNIVSCKFNNQDQPILILANASLYGNIIKNSKEGIYLNKRSKILTNTTLMFLDSKSNLNENVTLKAYYFDDNWNKICNATVNFIVNDSIINSIYYNGTYSCYYTPTKTGQFIISGNTSSNEHYKIINGTLEVYGDILYVSDLEMYYNSGEKLYAILLDSTERPLVNKTITFTINGKTYNKTTNKNGVASISINLAPNLYEVTVKYENITKTVTVTVYSTIDGKDIIKFYKNDTQYYAKFLDTDGNNLIYTDVIFNINGVFYTRTTDAFGIAKLNINLQAGNYIISAINPINNEMKSNNITVLNTIKTENITKMFNNGTKYYATFLNLEGTPLKNTEVKLNINGIVYNKKTDDNGIISLNINLLDGDYIITAYNPITTELVSSNIKILPILVGKDLTKKYSSKEAYEVTAYDNIGRVISNQNITININGVFYNRVTDENGIARLNINLNPGEYIVTAYYNKFATSNKINVLED